MRLGHVAVIGVLAAISWGLVFGAGEVLWHAAIGVHRLVAGM